MNNLLRVIALDSGQNIRTKNMSRTLPTIKTLALVSLLVSPTLQAATIVLDFNSLPSAQGWTYQAHNYSGADPAESSVYSVDGTQLTQNTLGQGVTYANYAMPNAIDPKLPFTISVTARVPQFEQIGSLFGRATAFSVYANTGTERFGFSLNTNTFTPNAGAGSNTLYLPIDATQFHDYRIEAVPGVSNNIFVDNVLYSTQRMSSSGSNLLGLGNASSYENGRAEITNYSFVQSPVPEPAVAWFFGAGLAVLFLRRKFTV